MIIIEKYGMNEEQADMVRVADLHFFVCPSRSV